MPGYGMLVSQIGAHVVGVPEQFVVPSSENAARPPFCSVLNCRPFATTGARLSPSLATNWFGELVDQCRLSVPTLLLLIVDSLGLKLVCAPLKPRVVQSHPANNKAAANAAIQ